MIDAKCTEVCDGVLVRKSIENNSHATIITKTQLHSQSKQQRHCHHRRRQGADKMMGMVGCWLMAVFPCTQHPDALPYHMQCSAGSTEWRAERWCARGKGRTRSHGTILVISTLVAPLGVPRPWKYLPLGIIYGSAHTMSDNHTTELVCGRHGHCRHDQDHTRPQGHGGCHDEDVLCI